jgi:putative PIN family toxin of toxin-antitoxin system
MRVVLDTNILARPSFSAAGPATELLERLQAAEHLLIVSEFILSELDRVLRYPRLVALHGFNDAEISRYVADIETASLFVDVAAKDVIPVIAHDPDDDPVIATAVVGKADVLCSLDRHLRRAEVRDYCTRFGIRVLTDVELLGELRLL